MFIALLAGLAQWFSKGGTALAMGLFLCLARVGSYAADTSPLGRERSTITAGRRLCGWAPPSPCSVSRQRASISSWTPGPGRASTGPPGSCPARAMERCAELRPVLLVHPGAARALCSRLLSVSHTYAIEYFQHAKGLRAGCRSRQQLGIFRRDLCHAVFRPAGRPFWASRADAPSGTLLLPVYLSPARPDALQGLWVSTAMMGVSFSVVPGHHLAGDHAHRRAASAGDWRSA